MFRIQINSNSKLHWNHQAKKKIRSIVVPFISYVCVCVCFFFSSVFFFLFSSSLMPWHRYSIFFRCAIFHVRFESNTKIPFPIPYEIPLRFVFSIFNSLSLYLIPSPYRCKNQSERPTFFQQKHIVCLSFGELIVKNHSLLFFVVLPVFFRLKVCDACLCVCKRWCKVNKALVQRVSNYQESTVNVMSNIVSYFGRLLWHFHMHAYGHWYEGVGVNALVCASDRERKRYTKEKRWWYRKKEVF